MTADASAGVVDLGEVLPADGRAWASLVVGKSEVRTFRVRRMRDVAADWHRHDAADEGFLVLSGEVVIDVEDESRRLGPQQMTIVPAGRRHRARAQGEALLLVFDAL